MKEHERTEPAHADVTRALNEAQVEPPPGFGATIMRGVEAAATRLPLWRRWQRAWRARRFTNLATARGVFIEQARDGKPARTTTPSWQGGQPVAKKMMWGIAGVAAVAIVAMWFTGFPPVDRGAEGTIGAAKRAQTQQLSDKDVVLGNAEAQVFLQSDVFDKLLKDPDAVKLLNQAAMRGALANREMVALLQDPGARAALTDAGVRAALDNGAFREAAADARLREAISDVSVRAALAKYGAALTDTGLRQAFDNAAIRAFMQSKAFEPFMARLAADLNVRASRAAVEANAREARAISASAVEKAAREAQVSAEARAAINSDAFRSMLESAAKAGLLNDASARMALGNRALAEALANAQVRAAVAQPALASVFARENVAQLMQARSFESAMRDANLVAMLGNRELQAALASPEFAAGMRSQAMVSALAARGFADAVSSRALASRVEAATRDMRSARE